MKWGRLKTKGWNTNWHVLRADGFGLCREVSGSQHACSKRWTEVTEEWPEELNACYTCRGLLGQGERPWARARKKRSLAAELATTRIALREALARIAAYEAEARHANASGPNSSVRIEDVSNPGRATNPAINEARGLLAMY